MVNALGKHLLLEMKDCDKGILNNIATVRNALVSAAQEAKATIVEISFHEFNPFGISGMVIIAESHLSIHTWPEYGYAAVDIFTCGDLIVPETAAKYLVERFKCRNPSVVEMKRGILPTVDGKLPHKSVDEKNKKREIPGKYESTAQLQLVL